MRKRTFLLVIVSCLFFAANSQKKAVAYGFQSGINLTTARGKGVNKEYISSQTGLSIGGNVKINLNKNWGLKAALFYEENTWAYRSLAFENNTGTGLAPGGAIFATNYLNLPMLAEYGFGRKIKYYLDGGPFLGWLLSSHTTTQILQPNAASEIDVSSDLNKVNFGIALGAGIKIPIATRIKLDIGIRNLTGFTNRSSRSEIKLNAVSVLAGLNLQLK